MLKTTFIHILSAEVEIIENKTTAINLPKFPNVL